MAYQQQQPPSSPPQQSNRQYQAQSPTSINYENQSQRTTPKRRRLSHAPTSDYAYGERYWTAPEDSIDFAHYLDHDLHHRLPSNAGQPFGNLPFLQDRPWGQFDARPPAEHDHSFRPSPQIFAPNFAEPIPSTNSQSRPPPSLRDLNYGYRLPVHVDGFHGGPLGIRPILNHSGDITDRSHGIQLAPPAYAQLSGPSPVPMIPQAHVLAGTTPSAVIVNAHRRKPEVTITLSRANPESIEAIEDHKRECPACQLDFEPDNYLAIISCCTTAMHANCLSAWVNSQTYAKNKVCMKCRKKIDARRPLNNVVPPVNDQIWDKEIDFNAPEAVKADTKIELDISNRQSDHRRRIAREARRDYNRYPRSHMYLLEANTPPQFRADLTRMTESMNKQNEALEASWKRTKEEWEKAFDAEANVGKQILEARDAHDQGTVTRRELDGLVLRFQEAKELQERRHRAYRAVTREAEVLQRRHHAQQREFLQEIEESRNETPVEPNSDTGSEHSDQ